MEYGSKAMRLFQDLDHPSFQQSPLNLSPETLASLDGSNGQFMRVS
jgi:hypothetical protein